MDENEEKKRLIEKTKSMSNNDIDELLSFIDYFYLREKVNRQKQIARTDAH